MNYHLNTKEDMSDNKIINKKLYDADEVLMKIIDNMPDYTVHMTNYTSRISEIIEEKKIEGWGKGKSSDCFKNLLFVKDRLWGTQEYWYYNDVDKKICKNIIGELEDNYNGYGGVDGIIVFRGLPSFNPKDLDYCHIEYIIDIKHIVGDDGTVIKFYTYDSESG